MARKQKKPVKKHRVRLAEEPRKDEASSESQRTFGLLKIPVPAPPQGLNTKDAARVLDISPEQLVKLQLRRMGPKFRRFGNRVIYSREALDEYREAHGENDTAEAVHGRK